MSLGGYKFAGRFCQKGSLTDQQWALLVHKTRLAAFMSSNTLSNAGWSFDQTGGDIAFESYGNVIYSLDSFGRNYVSFVKYGTDSPSYIAIITAFYWGASSSSDGKIDGPWVLAYRGNTKSDSTYLCTGNTLYHRLSKAQLTISNLFSTMLNATPLVPCGCGNHLNSSYVGSNKPNSFKNSSSGYFGYAMKDACVISISGNSIINTKLYYSILSGDAYSSMFGDDSEILLAYCMYGCYFGNDMSNSYGETIPVTSTDGNAYGVLYSSLGNGNVHLHTLFIPLDAEYPLTANIDKYPFCSVKTLGPLDTRTNSYIRGTVNVDLLCTSAPETQETRAYGSTVANGNLLFISSSSTSSSLAGYIPTYEVEFPGPRSCYVSIYVGWDPSNPDITQASAWTEYTDA